MNQLIKIRVLLADDHHMVRAAFAELLKREPDITIVGEAADEAALLEAVNRLQPDVLLMDAHMPGGKSISAARVLRIKHPDLRILVLSAYDRREYVVGMVRAGVDGYLLKHDSPETLVRAVRAVAQGEEWISPHVAEILMDTVRTDGERPAVKLSKREVEVLRLMAAGYRNEEIARRLVVTCQTVKNHVRKIFRKLGVETRVEAVLYAVHRGLVHGPSHPDTEMDSEELV
jgi:DNA-binding NarL/FixJ family response regulator